LQNRKAEYYFYGMNWDIYIKGFKAFLQLEKSLSPNSVEAYIRDVTKLSQFIEIKGLSLSPEHVDTKLLESFVSWVAELGFSAVSQARIISGIRAFYKYLLIEDIINHNPSELIEAPRTGRMLPDTLNIEDVEKLISANDLSKPEGERNKAIIETIYSCGLRVSELVDLKKTGLHFDEGYISVFGKGNKQRLVPISDKAICEINLYLDNYRKHLKINKSFVNHVFLNHRGQKLSRVMIFNIIKQLAAKAGIDKNISPHTFRHSFASHLVDGGADLRAVQDMLGHESITTTEIYTHLNFDYLRSAVTDFHPRGRMKYLKNEPTNMNLI